MKIQAIWNGQVLAESDHTVRLDGNHYFPMGSLNRQYVQKSDHHTICPWKGDASYYDVSVDGETNPAAAWYYPEPSRLACMIKGHVAFWKGVKVIGVDEP